MKKPNHLWNFFCWIWKNFWNPNTWIPIWVVCAAGVAIWSFMVAKYGYTIFKDIKPETSKDQLIQLANLGQYLSGSAVALLTLAATIMIFVAYLAQARQAFTQESERIERMFFELVGLHYQIVVGVTLVRGDGDYFNGQRCFADMARKLKKQAEGLSGKTPLFRAHSAFDDANKDYKDYLNHYFRNLYHIILLIDGSKLEKKDKVRLAMLLRAQLSNSELVLLFYNCLHRFGFRNFYPLVVKYAFFDNLDESGLFEDTDCGLYPAEAFSDELAKKHWGLWPYEECKKRLKEMATVWDDNAVESL